MPRVGGQPGELSAVLGATRRGVGTLVVAEVAYNASRTWLTRQAAERGCRTIDGLQLFVQQTALAFQAWTG